MTLHTRGFLALALSGLVAAGAPAQTPSYEGVSGGFVNLPPETHAEEYDRQLQERETRRDSLDESEQRIQDELDAAIAEMRKVRGLRQYLYGRSVAVVRDLKRHIGSRNEYVANTATAFYVGSADALANAIATNDVPRKLQALVAVRAQLVATRQTLSERAVQLDEEYTRTVGISDSVGDLASLRLPRTPELGNVWRNIGDQRWADNRISEVDEILHTIDATIGMHNSMVRAEEHLRRFDARKAMGVLNPWLYEDFSKNRSIGRTSSWK